jgi:hypothetical protein|tara:strand:+ start:5365 stop:5907 length:543 start_codon:yes stop_codon:yes gene_type:complete
MAKPKKSIPLEAKVIKTDKKFIESEPEAPKERKYKFIDPYWSSKEHKHLIVTIEYPDGRKATASIQDKDGTNPDYSAVLEEYGEDVIDANTAEGVRRRDEHIKKRLQRREAEIVRAKQEQLFNVKLEAFEIPMLKSSKNNTLKKLVRKAKTPLEVQALTSILLAEELKLIGVIGEDAKKA